MFLFYVSIVDFDCYENFTSMFSCLKVNELEEIKWWLAIDKSIIEYWSVKKKAQGKYTEKTKHFQNTINTPVDAVSVPSC